MIVADFPNIMEAEQYFSAERSIALLTNFSLTFSPMIVNFKFIEMNILGSFSALFASISKVRSDIFCLDFRKIVTTS